MRRLAVFGALALLLFAFVPGSAGTTPVTKHVDGSVVVAENANRTWLARFEVRTSVAGDVQFGYLELYGVGGEVTGEIHQFAVYHVDYYRDASGAKGAALWMQECFIVPAAPCQDDGDGYKVTDGPDTFMAWLGWTVVSGNISIYNTGGDNLQ